jgi:hypothetical protein
MKSNCHFSLFMDCYLMSYPSTLDIPQFSSFFSLFYFIVFPFTYMCLNCLLPFPPSPPTYGQNLFCRLLLWFCLRENIRDNKKDIVFCYFEVKIVLLPCTCVLKPILVHLCQTSSLFPGLLAIVASVSLWLLYSLLYSEHITTLKI